jgi:flagellar biosynthetic protein FlhB
MTFQQVKDENRETEGNPQIKSRLRQLMRKMGSRRMMTRVPKADVVVTNPDAFGRGHSIRTAHESSRSGG